MNGKLSAKYRNWIENACMGTLKCFWPRFCRQQHTWSMSSLHACVEMHSLSPSSVVRRQFYTIQSQHTICDWLMYRVRWRNIIGNATWLEKKKTLIGWNFIGDFRFANTGQFVRNFPLVMKLGDIQWSIMYPLGITKTGLTPKMVAFIGNVINTPWLNAYFGLTTY